MANPYEMPKAELREDSEQTEMEYVGFWARVLASVIDSILLIVLILPLLYAFYGSEVFSPQDIQQSFIMGTADFFISYILPAVIVLLFWRYKSATPGKMAIGAKIVDARTGEPASTGQLVGRYVAYYVSLIPLGLGYLWVAFDKRKQGFHDKLAGTVVVRRK